MYKTVAKPQKHKPITLQAGLRILTPGLSKDFGMPNYVFAVAYSVSTFTTLGTMVVRVLAVA
jgi:hypothetical protein